MSKNEGRLKRRSFSFHSSPDGVMAFIGHVARGGEWSLPRRFRAVAWMGGVELDLTAAHVPPEGTDLELLALFGVITVRVPADLRVELSGDAITRSADKHEASGAIQTRGTVRITGRSVLGKVHVRFVEAAARE